MPREDHLELHPKRVRKPATSGDMKLHLGDRGACDLVGERSLSIADQIRKQPSVSRVFGRALRCPMSTMMGVKAGRFLTETTPTVDKGGPHVVCS